MRSKINLGDVIYKLRHTVAEEKIIIGEVTEMQANSVDGKYSFNRTQLEPLKPINVQYGYTNILGESYVFKTDENEAEMERDIKLRFIRNYRYSSLTDQQIDKLLETINQL